MKTQPGHALIETSTRREVFKLCALQFVLGNAHGDGVTSSLATNARGKSLSDAPPELAADL